MIINAPDCRMSPQNHSNVHLVFHLDWFGRFRQFEPNNGISKSLKLKSSRTIQQRLLHNCVRATRVKHTHAHTHTCPFGFGLLLPTLTLLPLCKMTNSCLRRVLPISTVAGSLYKTVYICCYAILFITAVPNNRIYSSSWDECIVNVCWNRQESLSVFPRVFFFY